MDDVSVVLCGEAGQGIQTVETLLAGILKRAGYRVYSTKEYMSRIRGGSNSTEIRVSSKGPKAYVERVDIAVVLDNDAVRHLGGRITASTLLICDVESVKPGMPAYDAPLKRMAEESGGGIYANTVATGLLARIFNVPPADAEAYIRKHFSGKSAEVVENNAKALRRGYEHGAGASGKLDVTAVTDKARADDMLISGADAVGLGALAGGCNFIASYPMTPGTGVLTFLAKHAREFGVVAEQAEDEISAINMALGAWYAGARAMVTTSGGGYALMVEGVSLSGMLETPVVIHLGQRPGPATGLPTRTEQGDLESALYSGHGEFPRAVYAPGTVEEAYMLTVRAFDTADRYQVPAFILTDQYLMDTYYNVPSLQLPETDVIRHIVKTDGRYRRYEPTPSGVSPRGIPGYGDGLVMVDSDEHDEEGHITEDLGIRKRMVEKRLRKMEGLASEAIPPTLVGPNDYANLVVSWGSNYHPVREALEEPGLKDTAMLHFSQIHPLHKGAAGYLKKADRVVIVENNATGQFARHLRARTGYGAERMVLKYNGLPFSVEELESALGRELK